MSANLTTQKIKLACIGCGARGQMYSQIASEMRDKFIIVAAADPIKERLEKVERMANNSGFTAYKNADELLSSPKTADVLIISSQDLQHYQHCKTAIKQGYKILLEKPIASTLEEIYELEKLEKEFKSRIMVCYVLRFSPFYQKIKEIIDSGLIGEIISFNAVSGVSPWRMAHSFVRGHWATTDNSTPTIVAKACHDTDLIQWLINSKCKNISSFGSLKYFTKNNFPLEDKTHLPINCFDNCPLESNCIYNAKRYAKDLRNSWLTQIYDGDINDTDERIFNWLKNSNWGRCVYNCSNNSLDHQVVSMEFENGSTGTFTMTAFETGRHIQLYGTKGVLKGGETLSKHYNSDLIFIPHKGEIQKFLLSNNNMNSNLRKDRDERLMKALHQEMTKADDLDISTNISNSVHSHVIAFAAERARVNKTVVSISSFELENKFYEK